MVHRRPPFSGWGLSRGEGSGPTRYMQRGLAMHSGAMDDSDSEWIEQLAIPSIGFRIWHVMFIAFSAFLAIVILVCCCVKIRIPRTKQEIEADYQRKRIARKFRKRLTLIHNQDMDSMDLRSALERVRRDFRRNSCAGSQAHTSDSPGANTPTRQQKAEPQQPVNNFCRKLTNAMLFSRQKNIATDERDVLAQC